MRFNDRQGFRLLLFLLLLGHIRVVVSLVSQYGQSRLGPVDAKIALYEQIQRFAARLEPGALVHYWIGFRGQDVDGNDLFVQFCLAPSVVKIVKGELPQLPEGQILLTAEEAPRGVEVMDRSGEFLLLRKLTP